MRRLMATVLRNPSTPSARPMCTDATSPTAMAWLMLYRPRALDSSRPNSDGESTSDMDISVLSRPGRSDRKHELRCGVGRLQLHDLLEGSMSTGGIQSTSFRARPVDGPA